MNTSPNHPAPSAHTPTPWTCPDGRTVIAGKFVICDTAQPLSHDWTDGVSAANAALIVRAVNAFEPMRLALEKIAEMDTIRHPNHDNLTDEEKAKWTKYGPMAVIARAALALATPPERE